MRDVREGLGLGVYSGKCFLLILLLEAGFGNRACVESLSRCALVYYPILGLCVYVCVCVCVCTPRATIQSTNLPPPCAFIIYQIGNDRSISPSMRVPTSPAPDPPAAKAKAGARKERINRPSNMFPLDPKLEGEKRPERPTDQGLGLEKS